MLRKLLDWGRWEEEEKEKETVAVKSKTADDTNNSRQSIDTVTETQTRAHALLPTTVLRGKQGSGEEMRLREGTGLIHKDWLRSGEVGTVDSRSRAWSPTLGSCPEGQEPRASPGLWQSSQFSGPGTQECSCLGKVAS